ncbi:P-loop containing nucleoside triphosphate hydrolase protein [Xylona heveae TC161]|uniref:p-loop containing nucleoside triphosphate hydrolase protein n=1 Tax=Xylona heveae (strain CBS 132557 / TC161) TaxID=1328760 RepID=A0A165AA80_XYLHT|nr:P-loop containing nucleoside triphosphate hydrolase protein [Xylona heveae TC161]KZF20161.1 P-loop containing nucleoside triphosphate hydrolase protein [Xylona heveae TC161]
MSCWMPKNIVIDAAANDTDSYVPRIPLNILEAFIPGYSAISEFLFHALGFDITILVSIGFLIFALITSAQYIWQRLYERFCQWFTSTISVESEDDIYDDVMRWVAEQNMTMRCRSLKVTSGSFTAWDTDDDSDSDSDDESDDGNSKDTTASKIKPSENYRPTHIEGYGDVKLLNFRAAYAKTPPRFEPYSGKHMFFHKGSLFIFSRRKQTRESYYRPTEYEIASLTRVGRSTEPLKELLEEIREHNSTREKALTVIRRPASKESRKNNGATWTRVAARPSRALNTVVLDSVQKARVLLDINEYLHPATARWYANRGIPYRRGYLFHGPSGCGKTSLSFAIAGIFGLDIYVISLLEPTLTEEELCALLNHLPKRCVVLLEDIDSAGLKRKEKSDADMEDAGSKSPSEWGLVEVARALKQEQDEKKDKDKGISLSGLLNAIDGVASHEGRVLVMTTNYPDNLDDALIRPGRVDMQVQFDLATKDQIRELFIRMYSNEDTKAGHHSHKRQNSNGSLHGTVKTKHARKASRAAAREKKDGTLPYEELRSIARDFADHLPDGRISPAEIQGFLLMRKKEPKRALEQVDAWRDALLHAKEAKAKILTVQ